MLSNSPAINNGTSTGAPTNDQRGASRIGNTDIGAFELNNAANGGTFKTTLPNASQSGSYNTVLASYNDAVYPNYTFSITAGALPNGVSLTVGSPPVSNRQSSFAPSATRTVLLTGTPTQTGTFNFTATVSDASNTNSTDYTVTVFAPTAAGVTISGRARHSQCRYHINGSKRRS